MESTLLTSFLKASKIKRWLANSQASPIIPEIKSLYNRIYASNNSDDCSSMDNEDQTQTRGLVGLSIPKDIQPLLQNNNSKIHLQVRLKCDGIVYSTYRTHRGNSQVFFHPNGNKNSAPTAGFIQYIYSVSTKPNITFLVVQRTVPMDKSVIDPFTQYMHWPTQLYKSSLNKSSEQIQSDWISGHFAQWDHTSEHMVVLPLNRVC